MHLLVSEQYIDTTMHGATVKTETVNAQQEVDTRHYKNMKLKICTANASIWCNRVCRTYHLSQTVFISR